METLSHPHPSHAPQIQTSHLREARPTRTMQAPESQSHGQHLAAPTSQESILSADSYASSVGSRLQSSSSNLSQFTNHTDLASPASSAPGYGSQEAALGAKKGGAVRAHTPEDQLQPHEPGRVLASPMSVVSPMSTNGAKRTASGHVKNAPSLPVTPLASTLSGGRSRAESMSSTSSRASEYAAHLKTRLSYAMAKVQHGWEEKTFEQCEHLAAAQNAAAKRRSMSHAEYARRPMSSGLSNGAARLSMYDSHGISSLDGALSPPSKRHSGHNPAPYARHSLSNNANTRLQPAPEFMPRPHLPPSLQNATPNTAMSPPRTPVPTARRPPTIRTDTQTAEAERDALQALYQLGSPHTNSSNFAFELRGNSSQTSPLRSEIATPRRVTFARSQSESESSSAGGGGRWSSDEEGVREGRRRALEGLEGR